MERKTGTFSNENRENADLVHYYYEIVRNWNKINYIFKRKLKPSKKLIIIDNYDVAKYYIAIYRIIWEKEKVLKVNEQFKFNSAAISLLKKLESFSWQKTLANKYGTERLSLQLAIPSFMINKLVDVMNFDTIRSNINHMDIQGVGTQFYFRINELVLNNTKKNSSDLIVKELKKQGITFTKDKHYPLLYRAALKDKKALLLSNFFKENKLVIHDKASYTVAHLLDPQANDLILDMCAAPGIKTSIIAQLSYNKSKIIANDFNKSRFRSMNLFIRRLNVSNTHLINSDGIKLPNRYNNFFDKILLDAPCTGSGTFSTSPELKWRQNEGFLYQNVTLQEKLLTNAINLLKPTGILVYCTCSLYPEEGEYQILKILDSCKPMELPKWFSPSYKINHEHIPGTGRLFPAIHRTKGFFIAKFKKN